MKRWIAVVLALSLAALTVPLVVDRQATEASAWAEAVATRITIRVLSRDAKIIGTGVGGALVRVTNAETGELLAEGKHAGATGDTKLIMSTPHVRGISVYNTEGAAGYVAELPLTRPTVVNITATGPLGYPQAMQSASKQMLLVPGRHIEGDGVVLELHGYIVEIVSPEPLTPAGGTIDVRARVRMMCGCPITPGGMWNADNIGFSVRLKRGDAVLATAPLGFAGAASMFKGQLSVPSTAPSGDLSLEVLVSDPGNQNFGRHEIPLGDQATG
jgi:hypothetical protein